MSLGKKSGMRIAMSTKELVEVNASRVLTIYTNTNLMLPLVESPSLRIIGPTKAKYGYWNYKTMDTQTEDLMHALEVLEPEFQQLHQYDWSSGHMKGLKEGLVI